MDTPLNALVVLDGCDSGLATRGNTSTTRVVEVYAAVDGADTALGNHPSSSFTQYHTLPAKLTDHLAWVKGQGMVSIDFATAIAVIADQFPLKNPTQKVLLEKSSIRVQFDSLQKADPCLVNPQKSQTASSCYQSPISPTSSPPKMSTTYPNNSGISTPPTL